MTLRIPALAATALLLVPALAQAGCPAPADGGEDRSTWLLRSDNDLYGRERQDQGYTNGFLVTYVSPNVERFDADCLPLPARAAGRLLGWLVPEGEQNNLVIGFEHGTYTPTDGTRSDRITDDRPYAGVATMAVTLNARRGDRLGSTRLRLGMVGPSAQAELGQDSLHQWFGRPRFKGWDNQLRDEVVVQLAHERAWRRDLATTAGGWRWDAIGHGGAAVGNLSSYVNGGAELRFGKHLPDDFGSNPLRLAGDNSAPGTRDDNVDAIRWHGFIALDARWVGNDIVLDGNTWKDSHSVDAKDTVADLVLGIAITRGPWKFTATHVRRTREFEGQPELPTFGTLTFSRAF
ncbi:MAG TPA: lipid A deacylase LpxR family protein [Arenimonas sp.]|uniref:lipid A deacylase LpxR family protein n=1 Tax=Arenimonas sp. TaxID=1872635 RepID=UPI002D80762F|nr:lipid A deacylase LpxR family protein [Arenimonas sp.]HEU0153294.1 lipid A deacylase LpxR family protein [Arenimonas sp.]